MTNAFVKSFQVTAATAIMLMISANAYASSCVKPRKCPDGTIVSCTRTCPGKLKIPRIARKDLPSSSGFTSGQHDGATRGQAPKPGAGAKPWRDFVNGNPKPPIRPKP